MRKGSPGAYNSALWNGWLDEICDHMPLPQHGKWSTKKACHSAALQYKTRSEFHREKKGAYTSARLNGWLDDVCSHMNTVEYLGERYVYKIVCETRKLVYVGLTFSISKRKIQHESSSNHITKHFGKNLNLIKISGPHDGYEAAELEKFNIQKYRDSGYIVLNRSKGGSLGTSRGKIRWTKKLSHEKALTCDTIREFRKSFPTAYSKAHKMGWLSEITSHMRKLVRPKGYWHNIDNCRDAATHCASLSEFRRKFYQGYHVSKQMGWLDEVCSHMQKRSRNKCLFGPIP